MSDAPTRFLLTYADRPVGRLALLTMDDGQDHTSPTVFGEEALRSLSSALDELERSEDLAGVLITGKPHVFAAGADLSAFTGLDATAALEAAHRGHDAFGRLRELPVPTLAAINGVCMGGGVELALHCDARTVSSAARALAFPEVFLSIVPAWGGTQLAPRLVGAANAIEAMVLRPLDNNRTMRPSEALDRGFVDRVYDAAGFLDDSVAFLERLIAGDVSLVRDVDPADGLTEALAGARATAGARTGGATPAPDVALELIEFAARGGDLEEGRVRERQALSQLLPARQAQASVYAFGLTQQRVKKQPWRPDAQPRALAKVAVVGAGLMGAQIGALHLERLELPLVLYDVDDAVLARSRTHIEDTLEQRIAEGRLTAARAGFLRSLVTYARDIEAVQGADWVLEAASERMDLKRAILADLERVVAPDAVLATNTSSLSVAGMSEGLSHPERVLGFHFFTPVAALPLVEVIRPPAATDVAMATAFDVARRLRRSAVQCADAPGFIVNRLLFRFNGVAAGALAHGNGFREVDAAIRGLGLPMGPFALFGLVGLEVAHHVARSLEAAFPDRFALGPNLERITRSGAPGVYDDAGQVHPEVAAAVVVEDGASPLSAEEIRRMSLEAVADEARRMLDEGVVADARDIDTAMLLGAGWPVFNGGICMYLDQTGISTEVSGRTLLTPHDGARP